MTKSHIHGKRRVYRTLDLHQTMNLPEQLNKLHGLNSLLFPSQSCPPCRGGGLLQFRNRICSPPLQALEHVDHSVQVDQFPSTEK